MKNLTVFGPKPSARIVWGRMQYAPIRVHEKFVRSHISLHGYAKNAPGFRCKPSARDISGRMQYAPTRVHEKPGGFHISVSGHAKNLPDFTIPNKDAPKTLPDFRRKPPAQNILGAYAFAPYTGTCKIWRVSHFPHGYTKKPPDFTHPNKDIPKTRPILGPNLQRRTFGGVCFCALHGYMKNLLGFIFPHTDTPKTHPILPFPIRIHPKPARF